MKLAQSRVRVHRNLNQKCWSIVDPKTGKVVEHMTRLSLYGVEFRVQPGGRRRARERGVRNVHAYAIGQYQRNPGINVGLPGDGYRRVHYHPMKASTFVDEKDREVLHAYHVVFNPDGSCWVR